MNKMHRLLQLQLQKALDLGEGGSVEQYLAQRQAAAQNGRWTVPVDALFLQSVSQAYERYERDLVLCDRSLTLSSEELNQVNERLRRELQAQAEVLASLRQTANQLLQATGQPVLGDDFGGLVFLTQLMSRMVQQREQTQKDLAETLSQLKRVIIEQAVNAIVTVDEAGQIQSFNAAAERLFGHTAEAVIGCSVKRLMPEHCHLAYDQGLATYRVSGTSTMIGVATEVEGLRADGTLVPLELTVSEMVAGGVRMYVGIMADITLRKKSENQLRRSEATIRAIVETAVSAIVTIDWAGTVCLFNPAAEQLFGYAAAEVVGQNVTLLMPSPHREQHDRYLQEYQASGIHKIIGVGREVNGVRRDGDVFPLNLAVSELGVGEERMFVGILTDLTARKAVEKTLVDARELADQANRLKGDFLANMSHEIRTPMNAILGMTHLVLQTGLTDKQRDYLDKIQYSARNLLGILNDILDFSKIEAGKLALETIEFRLDDVLNHVLDMMGVKAGEKALRLELTCASDVPNRLVGDPLRLGQILLNLTNNAIKFTERGHVEITVQALAVMAQRVQVGFVVLDTGIGLTAAQQKDLFQAFVQADSTTTRRYGGTGLGLSICQRLVAMMEGEIQVESVPGVGSRFSFSAWFGAGGSGASERVVWEARQDNGARSALAGAAIQSMLGKRILLVEDNVINQQVAKELLVSNGLLVVIASDGEEALAWLDREPFDLVLLDIQMPKMDGYAVVRAIRRTPHLHGLPVVAMTAHAMRGDREKCLAAGMDDHLAKPIDPEQLFELLGRWLSTGQCLPASTWQGADHSSQAERLASTLAVDREAGVRQLGGNAILFDQLLRSFYQDYHLVVARLDTLLSSGQREEAMRLAHTLKGVAMTLGARDLGRAAQVLETRLRQFGGETGAECASAMAVLEQQAVLVWQQIAPMLQESPAPVVTEAVRPPGLVERSAVTPCVEALVPLLRFGHSRSSAQVKELRVLVNDPADPLLARLATCVDEYRFEEALACLEEWAGRLDIHFQQGA
ncbi:MAG: PAS domain S-box protein [Magnetococcales bacterium]|nr:PAS domain S-box protein [Magnetococcales bacterium]